MEEAPAALSSTVAPNVASGVKFQPTARAG